jgi:large subunit ribosomal protein L10
MNKQYVTKGTSKKLERVTELSEKISKSKAIVLTEYQGIKHKQLEELRRTLRKVDGEFVVANNRLFKKALVDKAAGLESQLEQPNAFLFAYKDEVSPLKEMMKAFKALGFGKVKGGLLGTTVLSENDVIKLSTVESKEVLLGKLVRQLNAPIQGLHRALQWNMNSLVWVLDAIKNKKTA